MKGRIHHPLAALLPLAVLLMGAGIPPEIVNVQLEGPAGFDLGGLRAAFFPLIGTPLSEEALLAAVDRAALDTQLGGIDVITVLSEDEADASLTIRFDGKPNFIELVDVAVAGELGDDHQEGHRLWRRVQALEDGLHLSQGRRLHPYHVRLDVMALRRWYERRGHLDVRVTSSTAVRGELVAVRIRALPGPRYKLGEVTVTGPTAGVTTEQLRAVVGRRPSPAGMDRARERLRSAVCQQGFPYTTTMVRERRDATAVVDLNFVVVPGTPPVRIVDVKAIGAKLPGIFDELGLAAGASYCVDVLKLAEERTRAYLRDSGFPNARVEVRERPRGPSRVAVYIEVDKRERATIARVWYRGHRVTRDKVLAQLVSVAPGQRFRQSEIDRSVDNLRRSGLFRRVSHAVIEGKKPGEVYVSFELVERDLVSVDFDARRVTLHNMDVALPTSVAQATDGVSLRGGGQQVRLTGSPDRIGVGIRDPFLWAGLVASVDLDLVFHSFTDLEETVGVVQVGTGLTALENQFQALLLLFADTTVRRAPAAYDALPVRSDDGGGAAGLGLSLSLDLNRLDEERVAYLGLGLDASARSSGMFGGKAWTSTFAGVTLNLPLYRNARTQHVVLQTSSRWRLLFDAGLGGGEFADDARLFAHRLLTPKARGYTSDALGQSLEVDGDEVLVGHRATWESGVALRFPLPWRRNALRAFLDLASGGGLELTPWDTDAMRPGVGMGLDFSLFDERLEGSLYGTLPLKDGPSPEYYVLSAGGSFD